MNPSIFNTVRKRAKFAIPILATIVLVSLASLLFAVIPNKQPFETDFQSNARLSRDELKDVIALAGECGIESVAKITTQKSHPGSGLGITVKGQEQVNGRVRTLKMMYIAKSKQQPRFTPSSGTKYRGVLWVRDMPRVITHGEFEVQGETFWVQLKNGITLEQGDQIIAALGAGSIEVDPNLIATKGHYLFRTLPQPWKPDSLFWSEKRKEFSASYQIQSDSVLIVDFHISDGILRVHEAGVLVLCG